MPSDEAVKNLVHLAESQWFERKSGRISAKDLAIPLVAMTNSEGGTGQIAELAGIARPTATRTVIDWPLDRDPPARTPRRLRPPAPVRAGAIRRTAR